MVGKIDSFDKVIGHKSLITYIQHWIDTDTTPNVLLFHGNPGLGKSSIAKLLAIALTTDESTRKDAIENVIYNNRSTGSIKLFSMSKIQDKEEEIKKVSGELQMNFVNTKHKVLILDEAHEMSKAAQDSILVELEHLPEGLHVFICTTEINAFRPALVSRCKVLELHPLSENEARQLFNREVKERDLTFELQPGLASTLICGWAENQPRKIINLLDNFENHALVKTRELEVFINTVNSSSVIELVKYLYGSMPLGIEYIQSIKLDNTFVMMLIEVTKVAMGVPSNRLSLPDVQYIQSFMQDKDVNKLLQFVIEVSGLSTLYKRRVISAFMRAHVDFKRAIPINEIHTSAGADIQAVADNIEDKGAAVQRQEGVQGVTPVDMLFDQLSTVEV